MTHFSTLIDSRGTVLIEDASLIIRTVGGGCGKGDKGR